jgi:hypothetical protein
VPRASAEDGENPRSSPKPMCYNCESRSSNPSTRWCHVRPADSSR